MQKETNLRNDDSCAISIPENIQESSLDTLSPTSNQNSQLDMSSRFTKSLQKGKDVLIEKVGYSVIIIEEHGELLAL